ncbi:MAG TPA: histidine kinase, partial [Saprospiraceae bacterium]|nr:histidine kinase [Saprospiraceae bacterium]
GGGGRGFNVIAFNPVTGKHIRYWNEPGKPPLLYNNSVRAVCLDQHGDLWICTNSGVNVWRAGRPKIEFAEDVGLPKVISVSAFESSDGTLWIANYSDGGHYYRPPGQTRFRPLQEHPVLKPYANRFGHCILEDSRGWMWFGLDGLGLICYNTATQQAQLWERSPQNDTTLIGNYVYALSEDPDGCIWAATSMGLSCIDPKNFRFTNYDRARGLPTNRLLTVMADAQRRIWMGTTQGLLMLDSTRRHLRQFDLNDGLPEKEFIALPCTRMSDGRIAMPTRRGLLIFYPEAYVPKEPSQITPLLSEVRVFNQHFDTPSNTEELSVLTLPPGKNFFSLDITALNYANPRQTWYAYKMEPYDQDWTYTRERTANYTNVPSGSYTFRYKATSDPNDWAVPERSLRIRVQEYWYLSKWLWGSLALVSTLLGISALRRRAQMREAILQLERKAQALAKEKALVQYENLTQQLNPHFLFNSLASLGSLIRFDSKTASEFLEALSKMYRYILQSRDRETVPLHEEMAFAEHFLKLQKT